MKTKYRFFNWNCPDCGQFGGVQKEADTDGEQLVLEIKRRHRVETYEEGKACDGDNIHLE